MPLRSRPANHSSYSSWKPSLEGFLKLKFDRAYSSFGSSANIIVQNHHRECVLAPSTRTNEFSPKDSKARIANLRLSLAYLPDILNQVLEGNTLSRGQCPVQDLMSRTPGMSYGIKWARLWNFIKVLPILLHVKSPSVLDTILDIKS